MLTGFFRIISSLRIYFITVLLASVTACGEGVGAGGAGGTAGTAGTTTVAEGGISGTGISYGRITAFSSVFVNGTRLEINSQTGIFIDEQPATETDLKVGHVIRVEAEFGNSTANRIDYIETVRGPLATNPGINPDTFAGKFDLLGQTILTNSATIFDGIDDVTTLTVGNVLDISGVRYSSGTIVARYIQLISPLPLKYRLAGKITNIDPLASTFFIGKLEVDYLGADISQLNGGVVEDGIEVRVTGLASSYDSVTSSIDADKITDSVLVLGIQNGDEVELEGAVTRVDSISEIAVNEYPVDASAAVIENGDVNDIVLDALLEVEGTVDSTNILIASKIKFLPRDNIRIDASVDSIDKDNNRIVVLGRSFQLDQKTQLEDNSSADIPQFSLDDLLSSDWVELRGYSMDGSYFLSRLEREDAPGSNDVRLQAPVDENGVGPGNTVTLLGITVSADGFTDYEDANDVSSNQGVFFNSVLAGDLVKARWKNYTSTAVPVDELSFE